MAMKMVRRTVRRFAAGALLIGAVTSAAQTEIPAPPAITSTSTRLVLLGTAGGPVARGKRSQPANLLQVGDRLYLIDAGDGVVRQLAAIGITPQAVPHVFITHLHIDHMAGLATLASFAWLARRPQPVDIVGPVGLKSVMNGAAQYMGVPAAIFSAQMPPGHSLSDSWSVKEIAGPGPTVIYRDQFVKVTAVENAHYQSMDATRLPDATRSYSYRFDTPDQSIVFTGDTGPSEAVADLARGADILVSEVIDVDDAIRFVRSRYNQVSEENIAPQIAHMRREHLLPEEVGNIAAKAGVKMVVLTHVVMGGDDDLDLRHYLDGVHRTFKGTVVIGQDLDQF